MKKLKKETKDKIFSVLKFVGTLLVEALWALLVFAFGFCVGADKFAGLRSSSVMKASAESISAAEVSTVSEETESSFDLTKYPSANLIPFPYISSGYTAKVGFSSTINGVTWSVNNDGSVTADGLASANSIFYINGSSAAWLLPAGTYSIGYGFRDCWLAIDLLLSDGTYKYLTVKESAVVFTVEQDFYVNIFRLVVQSGYGIYNRTFYPMLNVGEVAYPYSPSFDLIYNQGYNAGVENGEGLGFDIGYEKGYENGYEYGVEDGYENGLSDGQSIASMGFWQHSVISSRALLTDGTYTEYVDTIPDFGIAGGINLKSIGSKYTDDLNVSRIEFSLNFSEMIASTLFNNGVYFVGPAYLFGDSTVYFPVTVHYKGQDYTVDARFILDSDSTSIYRVQLNMSQFPDGMTWESGDWYYKSFGGLWVEKSSDFSAITMYSGNIYYSAGYNEGFNNGATSGVLYENGYKAGYTVGYDEGFIKGFDSTESGGFRWLINSVQAFLETDFFGDFSIGDLVYVMIGVSMVLLFLKFFSK